MNELPGEFWKGHADAAMPEKMYGGASDAQCGDLVTNPRSEGKPGSLSMVLVKWYQKSGTDDPDFPVLRVRHLKTQTDVDLFAHCFTIISRA